MRLKSILCIGAALCAIATAPAMARTHAVGIQVFSGQARLAVKSAVSPSHASNITTTLTTTTAISSASAYKVKTKLGPYLWVSNNSICQEPAHEKLSLAARKTLFARLGKTTETYSEGCSKPTKFYFLTYELETKTASGKTDHFAAALKAKMSYGGTEYDATLNINTAVVIGP